MGLSLLKLSTIRTVISAFGNRHIALLPRVVEAKTACEEEHSNREPRSNVHGSLVANCPCLHYIGKALRGNLASECRRTGSNNGLWIQAGSVYRDLAGDRAIEYGVSNADEDRNSEPLDKDKNCQRGGDVCWW